MNIEKKLMHIENNQLFTWGLLVIFLGIASNLIVFSANGYMMPVKTTENISFKDNFHFSYQDKNEIKLWLLSDWIGLKNCALFSLGDILLIIGFCLSVNSFLKNLLIFIRGRKKEG